MNETTAQRIVRNLLTIAKEPLCIQDSRSNRGNQKNGGMWIRSGFRKDHLLYRISPDPKKARKGCKRFRISPCFTNFTCKVGRPHKNRALIGKMATARVACFFKAITELGRPQQKLTMSRVYTKTASFSCFLRWSESPHVFAE